MKRILICIVVAAMACLAAVWAAPRTSEAATEWMQASPVHMRVLKIAGGLPVAHAIAAGAQAPPDAWRQTARRLATSGTLDAGMWFTMAGVICGVPHAADAVSLRLRTSPDGRSWSPWREAPLERAGEAGGPPQAFTEPVWTGGGALRTGDSRGGRRHRLSGRTRERAPRGD